MVNRTLREIELICSVRAERCVYTCYVGLLAIPMNFSQPPMDSSSLLLHCLFALKFLVLSDVDIEDDAILC